MSTHILVVDDEPDVESMFRQHFRRGLRSGRFIMEFALSAAAALERVKTIAAPSLILILSDINMPGMTGLEMLPKVKELRPDVPVIMITAYGDDGVIPGIRVATKTGNHVMAADLAELWAAAERIGGKAIDPLDPRFTCADAEGENRSR